MSSSTAAMVALPAFTMSDTGQRHRLDEDHLGAGVAREPVRQRRLQRGDRRRPQLFRVALVEAVRTDRTRRRPCSDSSRQSPTPRSPAPAGSSTCVMVTSTTFRSGSHRSTAAVTSATEVPTATGSKMPKSGASGRSRGTWTRCRSPTAARAAATLGRRWRRRPRSPGAAGGRRRAPDGGNGSVAIRTAAAASAADDDVVDAAARIR